ncbi:hypothetical protein [Ferruginibacter sp.]|uniref:hypothetical protein n=1 Tax=Ferruginibacter sp. TaxID=1940288 RepID=UPI00265B6C14|nr:hypothetical protein [Ferruginibacter sp.]
MSKSDQLINISVIMSVLIFVSAWIVGLATHKLPVLTTVLNLVVGLSIFIYWLQKQIRINQHIIEGREIVVLGCELIVIACAVYSIVFKQWNGWVKGFQYIFFGIHLSALVLFLIFMLTFKMNKLM